GGFYSYLPLPYKTSCKVLIRAPRVQFYQINYATYPDSTPIQSFTMDGFAREKEHVESAKRFLSMQGENVSAFAAPPGAKIRSTTVTRHLEPGKTTVLFESKRGG